MSAISDKYTALGGASGFLGKPQGPEKAAPDGVGRFRHYAGGSIYWHPSSGAREVHGTIRSKWAKLGWEKSVLGYPITDETPTPDKKGRFNHFKGGSIYWHPTTGAFEVHGTIRSRWAKWGWEKSFLGYPLTDESKTPDKVGRFNHFQHGSIYWKPSISAHEVHGLIRKLWADNGWEKNPELGYPIADELPTKKGGANRYADFENGVVFCKAGAKKAVQLSTLTIGDASKTAAEVLESIKQIMVPLMLKKVDGHQLYIKSWPFLGGPDPLGSAMDVPVFVKPVTDYSFDGSNVRNRQYKVRTVLGIAVDNSADITVTLDLRIEVFFDPKAKKVKAAPRTWWGHAHVPWPTSWGVSASEVLDKLKGVLDPQMHKEHVVGSVPNAINVLSAKVMSNGDLNIYMEPLV